MSKLEDAAEEGPAWSYCFAAATSMGCTFFLLASRLRIEPNRPNELEKAVMAAEGRWLKRTTGRNAMVG